MISCGHCGAYLLCVQDVRECYPFHVASADALAQL